MSVCEPSEITSDKVDVCGIAGFVISVCGPHTVKNEQLFVAVFRDGSNNEMIDTIQVNFWELSAAMADNNLIPGTSAWEFVVEARGIAISLRKPRYNETKHRYQIDVCKNMVEAPAIGFTELIDEEAFDTPFESIRKGPICARIVDLEDSCLCSVLGHVLSLKKADVLTPTSSRSPVSKLEMIVGDTEGYKADVTVWGDEALELCQDGNLKEGSVVYLGGFVAKASYYLRYSLSSTVGSYVQISPSQFVYNADRTQKWLD
eukprot:gene9920-7789_t